MDRMEAGEIALFEKAGEIGCQALPQEVLHKGIGGTAKPDNDNAL